MLIKQVQQMLSICAIFFGHSKLPIKHCRSKNSFKVSHHGYAPLYTLRKDHKPFTDPVLGPPTRPVCRGSAAYNNKLSHLLGFFLRPVWRDCPTVCSSTEEMLANFESVNKLGVLDNLCTIGSFDVTQQPGVHYIDLASIINGDFIAAKGFIPAF